MTEVQFHELMQTIQILGVFAMVAIVCWAMAKA
jgi:hypothetical protein